MKRLSAVALGLIAMAAYTSSCQADTITDWDVKATAVASFAAPGQREVVIVDLAMSLGGGIEGDKYANSSALCPHFCN